MVDYYNRKYETILVLTYIFVICRPIMLLLCFRERRLASYLYTVEICLVVLDAFLPAIEDLRLQTSRVYSLLGLFAAMHSTFVYFDII